LLSHIKESGLISPEVFVYANRSTGPGRQWMIQSELSGLYQGLTQCSPFGEEPSVWAIEEQLLELSIT